MLARVFAIATCPSVRPSVCLSAARRYCDLVLHPTTPDPLTLGWRTESDRLLPVLSKEPPAPDAVLQLVRCNCGSSSSRVQSSSKTCSCRCSCRSNSLVCTELCNCEADEDECQNTWGLWRRVKSKFLVLRTVIQRTYSVHAQCSLAFRVAAYYYMLLHATTVYSIKCTALRHIITIGEKGLWHHCTCTYWNFTLHLMFHL